MTTGWWDSDNGCSEPGRTGQATHSGEPLSCDQIRNLPDGAEVVVTWAGGNGPHPYRVLVESDGSRCVESYHADRLLPYDGTARTRPGGGQTQSLNRVTWGWDVNSHAVAASRPPVPSHVRERWGFLRGHAWSAVS